MGKRELVLNDIGVKAIDRTFRTIFWNVRSDDQLKIEGMDDTGQRYTWSARNVYDHPYGWHNWIIRNNQGEIFGGIKYRNLPEGSGSVLIFDYDDRFENEIVDLFNDVETEILNSFVFNENIIHRVQYKQEPEVGSNKLTDKGSQDSIVQSGEQVVSSEANKVSKTSEEIPDPDDLVPRYGTFRDLTTNDVRKIVKQCRAFMDSGGTIASYHLYYAKNKYSLDTLRKWLNNPKFKS